jgi:gamma-glutamylcyclotransferase (GGCT)/AIG2-like uncharacterized protein YtfP
MMERLFVYGTLLPSRVPAELREMLSMLRKVDSGSMPGYLYDFGEFPGAIYDQMTNPRVHGEIFELPTGSALLALLDEYEGCIPADPGASLFIREKRPIELANGSHLNCWVYLYNRDPGAAPLIPGGDYSEWTLSHPIGRK